MNVAKLGLMLTLLLGVPRLCWCVQGEAELDLARRLNQAFVAVAEKVSPAVVVVNVTQQVYGPDLEEGDQDGRFDSLPPGFWRRFHQEFQREVPDRIQGQGSGVILRPDGYILTNRHVVEEADTIEVRLHDGRSFKAVVRGVDPQSDVAVIKIQATNLPVAKLADSDKTRVGEFAIAIGSPFNLDYSVTFGHVSAKSRADVVQGLEALSMDQDFIQTDANINPGNSGGPLVNIEGEVIGINTLIRGLRTGIGFAIPSNLAREVAEQLIAHGKYSRPWLGIKSRAVRDDPDLRDLAPGVEDGVVVASILSHGPAAKSALRAGDVITAVDKVPVGTPQQLRAAIRGKKIGSPVSLKVFRRGKATEVKVALAEWSEPVSTPARTRPARNPASRTNDLGLTVQILSPELAQRFGVDPAESGVVITAIQKGSLAGRKPLRAGDIITSVDQRPVATPDQFRQAVRAGDLKKGLLLNILTRGTARFEIVRED